MPIKTVKWGLAENVKVLEFGTGDILFAPGKETKEVKESLLLIFAGHEGKVAQEFPEMMGKSSDDVGGLEVVLKFGSVRSLNALIHSLIELQDLMLFEAETAKS